MKTSATQYRTVSGTRFFEVDDQVNKLLANGWQLYGLPSEVPFYDTSSTYQVIKYTVHLIKD